MGRSPLDPPTTACGDERVLNRDAWVLDWPKSARIEALTADRDTADPCPADPAQGPKIVFKSLLFLMSFSSGL